LPSNGSSDQTNTTLTQQEVLRTDPKEKGTLFSCRCPATGVVIQFFQKCKAFKHPWPASSQPPKENSTCFLSLLSTSLRTDQKKTAPAYCCCQSTASEQTKNKTPPLPCNGSSDQTNTTFAQQRVLGTAHIENIEIGRDRKSNILRRNISMDTNTHKTIEELYGAVLPIRSAKKLYKECKWMVHRFLGLRPQSGPNRKHHLLIVVTMQQPQNWPKTDPKEKALLCRCPATGAVIQFFQKCKWSWNVQNHIGEVGDDSSTVRTHQTHTEAEKQSYIRSEGGRGPSDKHHICPTTGPWNGPRIKIQPIERSNWSLVR
jgi:hypothetical protein